MGSSRSAICSAKPASGIFSRGVIASVDSEARESGAELARGTWKRMVAAGIPANAGGALVLFLFLGLVGPWSGDSDELRQAALRNGVALVLFMAVGFPLGIGWRRRYRWAPVERWLRAERPATDADRDAVLRSPMDAVKFAAFMWGIAAILFTLLNLGQFGASAVVIGVTLILGGATTCALIYLLNERVFRPITARALDSGLPQRAVTPGVAGRLTMAWILGTGVPAVGVVVVATVALVGGELDESAALGAALFLGMVALGVGLAATLFASRSVAEPVVAMRGALGRVHEGDFEARVEVDDGSEVGLLQAGFNEMAAGLAERERIRDAFGTYVDRDVAEHILREGTALEGEEVEVTMMFMDVRGFTSFAEKLSASEVVATLNRLFERIVPIIHAHEGHVDKYVGDGLLAVFGAPRRQADHADRALAAALEIAEAVKDEFGEALSVGIGLNSGLVVAGNVGGAGRLEFSVIGDAVNVAARVESATRQTGDLVLIAGRTKDLLSETEIDFVERPGLTLKGKTQAVEIYAPPFASTPRAKAASSRAPEGAT
jgi:adenylate cyclase